MLFSADGQPLDLRDPEEQGLHADAKWQAPETINGPDPTLVPLRDKQLADIYALGATIVEVRCCFFCLSGMLLDSDVPR